MEFPVKTGAPASQRTECAILPIFEDGALRGATKEVDVAARGMVKQLVRNGDVTSRFGGAALIHRTQGTAAERWLFVGCGNQQEFTAKRFAGALASAVQALRGGGVKEAVSYLAYDPPVSLPAQAAARATVEAARATAYRFDELKSRKDPAGRLTRLGIGLPSGSPATRSRHQGRHRRRERRGPRARSRQPAA